ncbi:MAG: hypothetical protein DME97_13295 [Verrucomicrobia bacterium]|nr:MAG: hypothetical protein DME97_13295 [Verrucomicrobiota bacterium]
MQKSISAQLFGQVLVVALILNGPAVVRGSGATPLGAVTLEPSSTSALADSLPNSVVMEMVCGTEQQVLPNYNEQPIFQFSGRSSSPDFASILQSMDSPEYAGGEPMAPVPETSTWVAAFLGALAVLRALQKKFGVRILRAIR